MDPADAGMDNPPETASDDLIERLRNFDMVNHSLHDELPELLITAASRLAALQQRVEELGAQKHQAVGDVAELIERLEGWLDYRPMQEFCSEALKDLREAASSLAALQQRVEELEQEVGEFDEANRDLVRFQDRYMAKAEAAEARERVLREALHIVPYEVARQIIIDCFAPSQGEDMHPAAVEALRLINAYAALSVHKDTRDPL
jgi:BMFP domain-containing protein YqiC